MRDDDCVRFLQWALPQRGFRWEGFRRVRGQVCKRIKRRLVALGLDGFSAYRSYLELHPEEWMVFDAFCPISITRFWRDKSVFALLHERILPELAESCLARGQQAILCWSAGCAGGEEAYSIAIAWEVYVRRGYEGLGLRIIASDIDARAIERAKRAVYHFGSIKDLPPECRARAFRVTDDTFSVRSEFRAHVDFMHQDILSDAPLTQFHLILCRNLAFTYFAPELQARVLRRFAACLAPRGVLMLGKHEELPSTDLEFERIAPNEPAFRLG